MRKLHILGVAVLGLMVLVNDAAAQRRGGAVRGGVRGSVVGGMVGGSEGARTGAQVGVVTGATRAAIDRESERRTEYQATTEYQNAPRSNFNEAPPEVIVTTPSTEPAEAPSGEAVIRRDGKPVVGITYPEDWNQTIRDLSVTATSEDGQAWSAIALLQGINEKQDGVDRVKEELQKYLDDVKYDDPTQTRGGALMVTGTGKGKQSGIDVVFAAGVFDAAPGQVAGAAFVVDSSIEDHYKELVRQICRTIRRANEFTDQN